MCGGTLRRDVIPGVGAGSIPACAGEPCARDVILEWAQGLSPRVRGNPGRGDLRAATAWVYPRVCGGTPTADAKSQTP